MDDHYFGQLKERVAAFMKEVDEELWKLGVFTKTKHNEAAPSQHEVAPIFSTANIASDHNQITMEILKKVANHHDLYCLLHEKPYRGITGSGKHNNWSIGTSDGENLLKPGKKPAENVQFLLFFASVIKAVDDYSDLLRVSVATAGNDHRLGAQEAPPAIVSMYLGDQLTDIVEQLINGEGVKYILPVIGELEVNAENPFTKQKIFYLGGGFIAEEYTVKPNKNGDIIIKLSKINTNC